MTKAKIIFYAILCFILTFAVVRCEAAQEDAKSARSEAKDLASALRDAETENAKLRDILTRTNAAMDRALRAAEDAQRMHDERLQTIHSDPDARSWLDSLVPDSVCKLFAPGGNCAASSASVSVPQADGDN